MKCKKQAPEELSSLRLNNQWSENYLKFTVYTLHLGEIRKIFILRYELTYCLIKISISDSKGKWCNHLSCVFVTRYGISLVTMAICIISSMLKPSTSVWKYVLTFKGNGYNWWIFHLFCKGRQLYHFLQGDNHKFLWLPVCFTALTPSEKETNYFLIDLFFEGDKNNSSIQHT